MDTIAALLLVLNRELGQRYAELYKNTRGPWALATHVEWRNAQGIYQDVLTAGGSGAAAGNYDGQGDVPRLNLPTAARAFGYWAQYPGFYELTDVEVTIMEAASARGSNVLGDQLMLIAEKAVETMLNKVKTDFAGSAGTGTTDAAGIAGIVNLIAESGTIFGINRGTVTTYQSYVNDNSGTPRALTRALIQDVVRTLMETRGGAPNTIIMSPTQFFLLFDDSDVAIHNTSRLNISMDAARDKIALNMGFDAGQYFVPGAVLDIAVVPDHTTNRVEVIDRNDLIVEHLLHSNFGPKFIGIEKTNLKTKLYFHHILQAYIRNPWKSSGAATDCTTS